MDKEPETSVSERIRQLEKLPPLQNLRTSFVVRLGIVLTLIPRLYFYGFLYKILPARAQRARDFCLNKISGLMKSTLGTLKGPLLRVSQVLTYSPHILPQALRDLLLPVATATHPYEPQKIRKLLEYELGQKIETVFAEFKETPFATASVSQIHWAKLRTGQEVAVKILYPGIHAVVSADLLILKMLTPLIWVSVGIRNLPQVIGELDKLFYRETDLAQEAEFLEKFRQVMLHRNDVIVPKIYPDYSTASVLTMEFIYGEPYYSFVKNATQEEKQKAAETIFNATGEALLGHNMFNADPHPGNFLFQKDKVVFIDFGLFKEWSPQFIIKYRQLVTAAVAKDEMNFSKMCREFGLFEKTDAERDRQLMLIFSQPKQSASGNLKMELNSLLSFYMKARGITIPLDFLALGRIYWGTFAIVQELGMTFKTDDRINELFNAWFEHYPLSEVKELEEEKTRLVIFPLRKVKFLIKQVHVAFSQGAKIVQLVGFPFRVFCFSEPEDIERILVFKGLGNRKIPKILPRVKKVMRMGSYIQEGEYPWQDRRRQIQRSFGNERYQKYMQTTQAIVNDWVKDVPASAIEIDIYAELRLLLVRINFKVFFGYDLEGEELKEISACTQFVDDHFVSPMPLFIPTAANLRFIYSSEKIRNLIQRIAEERAAQPPQDGDIIDNLLASKHTLSQARWSVDDIVDECLSVYYGASVVSITLTWAMDLLAKNPHAQEQIRTDTVGNYTDKVFKEVVRLYPASWGYPRWTRTGIFIRGQWIPPKSVVIPMILYAQHNPRYWTEPERFNPDRFDGQESKAYYPFSKGPRACLGMHWAPILGKIILNSTIKKYQVTTRKPNEPLPYEMGFEYHPQGTVPLKFEKIPA